MQTHKEKTIKADFKTLKLHTDLVNQATKLGLETPTPIQAQAIPAVLGKKDVTGLAQTGTGKTAAFLLPIMHHILTQQRSNGVSVLILAPTRELAEQIHSVADSFGRHLNIRSLSIYGGVNIKAQINSLKRRVDIVVACPGRLLDHMNRRTIDLSQIETLVLDEADQMLDMGFLPDIKKIVTALPRDRQTLMFSATMPREIERLAQKIQENPFKVQVDRREVTTRVAHSMFSVQADRKTELLQQVLDKENSFSTLVFTRTKHRAKRLARQLSNSGHKTTSLHGNLSVNQRRHAVDGFKKGKYHVMVATDIASRGIDISGISHVVNYDVPTTAEAYIHRIGRTGRAAENGVAYTFASREENLAVTRIERALKQKLAINRHGFS